MFDRRPHPVRWLRDHPTQADATLAVMLTTMALVFHLADFEHNDTEYVDPSWWTVILVFGSVFPIAWRRSHTVAATVAVVLFQVTAAFADVDGGGFVGVTVALYSLGAHSTGPVRLRVLTLVTASIGVLFVVGLLVGELDVGSAVFSTVILVTAFVLGDNLRGRRDAAVALEERANRAERERELIAQREVNAERSRIARELHDVVAHSVSVMVIQAAAARRSLPSSPVHAEQALTNIEDLGRQTMNELRGILGVLRRSSDGHGDPSRSPQPSLSQIETLVGMSDDLPIALSVSGDLDDLPNSITLTGYRVIQEALTNIRRHAGPVTSVEVWVDRRLDALTIRILDDGRGAAADDVGPGYGILGMRERVAAVGGTVDAGSRPGGGWRVAVSIPTETPRTQTADTGTASGASATGALTVDDDDSETDPDANAETDPDVNSDTEISA
jgi:signal transduction histidine kinase